MGVRHVKYPIDGVQFHPESILCEDGKLIIKNFLEGSDGDDSGKAYRNSSKATA